MEDCIYLFASLLILLSPISVSCHARLMEPPSRSSMWRVGFATKRNFNDNALYCGGVQIQWLKNGGKCGICGDPWNVPHPRPNEAGGVYGKGIISRKYIMGQRIKVTVDVTTNHRGYFEFRICPNNNPLKEASQDCLDKYLLKNVEGTGTQYNIADKGSGKITLTLQLPAHLTCSQCVFQWTYIAGNNWGRCPDGSSRIGCGPQETFRGCADVAIEKSFTYPQISNGHQHYPPYRPKNTHHTSSPHINIIPKYKKQFLPNRNGIPSSFGTDFFNGYKQYPFIYQSPKRWHFRSLISPSPSWNNNLISPNGFHNASSENKYGLKYLSFMWK